ncbi:hypothetical protein [Kitasatospora sp. NPDC057015]|uniref:hypothetical protein n=1 Tax=Kitasatospora sp. NPDC057015 TaxID=3346001 RepID=UPI00362A0611
MVPGVGVGGPLDRGLAVERGHDPGGEADPGPAGLGLRLPEVNLPVVDRGEGPADVELAVHEVDVRPVRGENLTAAHAGAEHDLEQVGQLVRVLLCTVLQEGRGLLGGPAGALGCAGLGRHGVLGRVVAQPPRPHRNVQRVAQGGHGPMDGDTPALGLQLCGDPGADVLRAQAEGPEVAEGGQDERA